MHSATRSLTRKALAGSAALATAAAILPASAGAAESPPHGDFFSTVSIAPSATTGAPATGDNANHGDLWPNCWSNDDEVYTAYGDGIGFGGKDDFSDVGVAKVSGMPGNLTGTQLAKGDQVGQVWGSPDGFTRKPTGMACVGGTLYLAVQDLAHGFNEAPRATIARSTDHGKTWTWDHSAPMFRDGTFSTVMFLDYGKAYGHAPDNYVYAYGLDGNWRDSFDDSVPDPADVYLARVPKNAVQDRSKWEFVSGFGAGGAPTWSSDIAAKKPVLHDDRRVYPDMYTDDRIDNLSVISQGGVVYNAPLKRYIYTSWTEYTYEFYESPSPWGPWKRMDAKDFGGYPWTHDKHGGYATTIPSKYISADGRSMWLQSNVCPCGAGVPEDDNFAYTYSLRKVSLEPYAPSLPTNSPDDERNLATEPGTVPIERTGHFGRPGYYNDGNLKQNEDDRNDERKTSSWWGYTWPRQYTVNRVAYTTGAMSDEGGWFSDGLRVQVRRGHEWRDATGLRVSPTYPNDEAAGKNRTYTLSFDPVAADGVRIVGTPGGSRTFTSIAELAAYYAA